MAERDMVTLVAPDGTEYRTDQPTEVTTLITGYGYRRKSTADNAPSEAKPRQRRTTQTEHPAPTATDDPAVSEQDEQQD